MLDEMINYIVENGNLIGQAKRALTQALLDNKLASPYILSVALQPELTHYTVNPA